MTSSLKEDINNNHDQLMKNTNELYERVYAKREGEWIKEKKAWENEKKILTDRIKAWENEKKILTDRITILENKFLQQEKKERKNNIVIKGIEIGNTANTLGIIRDFITKELDVEANVDERT
ncbi:hypothetical protein QE152_g14133 [Popillia japonica]|uniref:Uncharacterized protein n=1 Tax=Popillia japonica TaxID=7064 RepID=A0AAW1LA31_POPJA